MVHHDFIICDIWELLIGNGLGITLYAICDIFDTNLGP